MDMASHESPTTVFDLSDWRDGRDDWDDGLVLLGTDDFARRPARSAGGSFFGARGGRATRNSPGRAPRAATRRAPLEIVPDGRRVRAGPGAFSRSGCSDALRGSG